MATNPDQQAMDFVKELLEALEFDYVDGDTARFQQIDVGFASKPVYPLYASIQPVSSRAPVVRLGRGAGPAARDFEIDLLLSIEYEDMDPERGARRLSQLRWEVFQHLAARARSFPGVEIANFDEAILQSFTNDDGGYQDWGYIGQILIPFSVVLRGTD